MLSESVSPTQAPLLEALQTARTPQEFADAGKPLLLVLADQAQECDLRASILWGYLKGKIWGKGWNATNVPTREQYLLEIGEEALAIDVPDPFKIVPPPSAEGMAYGEGVILLVEHFRKQSEAFMEHWPKRDKTFTRDSATPASAPPQPAATACAESAYATPQPAATACSEPDPGPPHHTATACSDSAVSTLPQAGTVAPGGLIVASQVDSSGVHVRPSALAATTVADLTAISTPASTVALQGSPSGLHIEPSALAATAPADLNPIPTDRELPTTRKRKRD